MKDKYYLALANEVEITNKEKVKYATLKLFIIAITLLMSGIFFVRLKIGNRLIYRLIIIAFLIIFVCVAKHFILTTKIFNQRLRLQGISRKIMLVYLILLILLIVFELIHALPLIKFPFAKLLFVALSALTTAIFEEFIFRGMLFNAFLLIFHKEKYGILWASIMCSSLFSLAHLNNLTHQSFISTVGQMIFALAFGLILSCLRIWSNSLNWCIIMHFLQDFSPRMASADYGTSKIELAILVFVPIMIFASICIYMLNRRYLELKM